jgi:hypothetical protein
MQISIRIGFAEKELELRIRLHARPGTGHIPVGDLCRHPFARQQELRAAVRARKAQTTAEI